MRPEKLKGTTNEGRLEIVVGKDILELLSSSMYVDPLTIYREYVQNAADAIDEAVAAGTLSDRSDGRIEISLDHIGRRARIRDNGIGVSRNEFRTLLTSIGASHKRGTSARGFRGVGRLAGLGYCQELVFRSRRSADEPVQELKWNCRLLKQFLSDPAFQGGLEELVSEIISISDVPEDEYPAHFFEVEIVKPIRIGSDILLNESEIESFLSQVGPVPFAPEFRFAQSIREGLDMLKHDLSEYDIRLNGAERPVYRPFRDTVSYSEAKIGQCHEVETFEIHAVDGELAAYGWILHHEYQGAIPEYLGIRGLRARVGNIQVGGERKFLEIFPEERFNSWTIGELHILDARIKPNGRRDDFEQNSHLTNLINHLTPQASNIARHCRSSSQIRARVKTFEIGAEKIEETLSVLEQGAISKAKSKELKKEIGSKLQEIKHASSFDLLYDNIRRELKRKTEALEARILSISESGGGIDPLDDLPSEKKEIFSEVIDLIYECSVNRVAAKSLVDRILSKIALS